MPLHLTLAGETHAIEIVRRKPSLVLEVDGRRHEISGHDDVSAHDLVIDGARITPDRALIDEGANEICFVRMDGRTFEIGLIDPREEIAGHDSARDEIHAPMPGAVVSVHKQAGEAVARGETLVTIESMKLQTALVAPRDGHALDILRGVGETFEKGELLARLAPTDEA